MRWDVSSRGSRLTAKILLHMNRSLARNLSELFCHQKAMVLGMQLAGMKLCIEKFILSYWHSNISSKVSPFQYI